MARPRDRGEVKTATINIRVTPTLKEKLEAHTKIAGRKLSAECEERLLQSMIETEARASEETEELLREIKRLIGEIEQATGHTWTENLGTWAAVAEMLGKGPIMERTPWHVREKDERLNRRYDELMDAMQERERLAHMLALMGLVTVQNTASFDKPARDRDDLRELARNRLMEEQQEAAEALIAQVEDADERERKAVEEIDELIEVHREAIQNGRQLYPQPKKGALLSAALYRLDSPTYAMRQSSYMRNAMNALLGKPSSPPDAGKAE